MRCEPQLLKVLIIVSVFPQMYMGFFEMKYVLLIEGDLSDWMLLEIPEMSLSLGTERGLLISNFEKFFKNFYI